MKKVFRQSIAFLMVLAIVLSIMPAVAIQSSAASYIYNWGTREVVATELSSTAQNWYSKYNIDIEELLTDYSGNSSASSVPSSTLYKKLQSLMKNAHSYINSYKENNTLLAYTDCQNGGGAISSFYSGTAIGPSWNGTWNKEHTWPNSKGLDGSDEDDVMMIRPTKTSENSSRGNTAYGEASGYYNPNSESNGTYDLRGDCARIVLYVYVRWGNTSKMWGSSGVIESKNILLKWMEEDPVDTWELGRNDAVQSITGTRNMFVDYPELAFALFDADIPDMVTPSGYADQPDYTITATSNNTAYGTVSVDKNVITATPESGYYASGYTVTSGSAAVTQNGNTFTVSTSADCSIRINFAVRAVATVSFSGASVSSQTGYAGEVMSLPDADAPDGYSFVGWTTSALDEVTTVTPEYYTNSFTPVGNTILYALYSYTEEGNSDGNGDYVKVTTAPTDWSGEYLIVYEDSGYIFDSSLSDYDNTNNYKTVTISDNTISASAGDPYKFTVSSVSGGYSIKGVSGQYVGHESNVNGLTTSNDALVNTISLDDSGNVHIIGSGGAYLRFNNNSSQYRFRYYKSSSYSNQKAIALYMKNGAAVAVCYTSEPTACAHEDAVLAEAVESTCISAGVEIYHCNDCERSFVKELPLGDHSFGEWVEEDGVKFRSCINCGEVQNGVLIVNQPKTVYGSNGDTVKTSVTASGDGLTYQWYVKNAGATSYTRSSIKKATYSCKMSSTSKDRYIRCKITDQYGNSVWTNTVRLRMKAQITEQPATKCGKNGDTAVFQVAAIGSNLSYQWQYRTSSSGSWKSASATGNKTEKLSVPCTVSRNGYQYRCKVTDGAGNVVYSVVVRLYVLGIKTQPVNKTVQEGSTAKFTVTATGSGLTYQWQYRTSSSGSWKNASATGNKTATLSVPGTDSRNGFQYRCKITDSAGNVIYTKIVTLTVQ